MIMKNNRTAINKSLRYKNIFLFIYLCYTEKKIENKNYVKIKTNKIKFNLR